MALTKVTGQVINTSTDVTVGVLTVTNTLAVGGTVSIGGTLTYEDVTNIDSVGLITARDGIVVGSGITLSKDGDIFATGVTTATTFVGALTGNVTGDVTGNVTGNISGGTVAGSTGTFTGDVDIADKIIHTGDTNTAIRFPEADTITAETGGSERLRINSSGNVLIKTTDVGREGADELTISGSDDTGMTIRSGSSHEGNIYFSDGSSGGNEESRGIIRFDHSTDSLQFFTASGDNFSQERLRITSGGLMGLATDDPTGTLSIASGTFQTTTPTATGDDIVISGNQSLGMQFLTLASGTSNNNIYFGDTDDPDIGMIRYAHANDSMQFQTNTEERLRISSTGYVGINDTSPESRLTVFSTDRHVQQLKSETGVTAGTTSGTIYRQQYTSAGTSRRMGFFGIKRDGGSGDQRASFVMELCPDNSTSLGLGSPAASTTAFEFTRTGALKVKDGGGLDFSNTTSASGTTNQLLDDYEEGTHTPTFTNLDVPSHITTDHFSYTRIGRLVHIEFQFTVSSSINDASGFQFTLPFGTHGNRNITIPCISNKSSGAVPFAFVHHTNGTNMLAREETGDYSSLTYNHFSGDTLTGGGTYETDE